MRIFRGNKIECASHDALTQNGLQTCKDSPEFQDLFSFLSVVLFESDRYQKQLKNIIRNAEGKVLMFVSSIGQNVRRPTYFRFLNH